jgi:hypothetical protein
MVIAIIFLYAHVYIEIIVCFVSGVKGSFGENSDLNSSTPIPTRLRGFRLCQLSLEVTVAGENAQKIFCAGRAKIAMRTVEGKEDS